MHCKQGAFFGDHIAHRGTEQVEKEIGRANFVPDC